MPYSGYLFVERKEPGKMPHSGYLLCTLQDVILSGNVKHDFPAHHMCLQLYRANFYISDIQNRICMRETHLMRLYGKIKYLLLQHSF
jgi:hypothetical protein